MIRSAKILTVTGAWAVLVGLLVASRPAWTAGIDTPGQNGHRLPWCGSEYSVDGPCDPVGPQTPLPGQPIFPPDGYTGMSNPAAHHDLAMEGEDPLAGFVRRPLDRFIISEGGLFMDPSRDEPHYGVDYTYPEDYLQGIPLEVHPIGPGYVTARSSCLLCFVDGDEQGRTEQRLPQHNFGFGGLVVIETPFDAHVSIYVMYAHLRRDWVGLGDYVTPDEVIALAGTTGYSQEIHLHMEVRYGAPGRFWNADFSRTETLDRWLATPVADPALLVFPENHAMMVERLNEWVDRQPRPAEIP